MSPYEMAVEHVTQVAKLVTETAFALNDLKDKLTDVDMDEYNSAVYEGRGGDAADLTGEQGQKAAYALLVLNDKLRALNS